MERLYPMLSTSLPAGNANTKYDPKKANWINMLWKYESEKMDCKCGIRMSFMQVRNPHMKNRVVTMLSARLSVLEGPSSNPAEDGR